MTEQDESMSTDVAPSKRPVAHRAVRPLFFLLGVVCVGFGYLGIVVPGMPATVFFLVSLWSFKKSSPKLEHWLLWKSPMGPTLRDWDETRSIRKSTKLIAIAAIWISILASIGILIARERPYWVSGLLLATALTLTWYLWTRKTKE